MFSFSREQGEETGRKMENLLILMLFGRKGKACLSVYLPVCLSLRYLAALMLRGFSSALSLSLSLCDSSSLCQQWPLPAVKLPYFPLLLSPSFFHPLQL